MPLLADAAALIRENLKQIAVGQKARLIEIGTLTQVQLSRINEHRASQDLPPINSGVVFIGKQVYQSRIEGDGYTIEDVVDQISNAMHQDSVVIGHAKMTIIENPNSRADRFGNKVRDRAVFECTARHPRPELFSVIPKGDSNKPQKQKGRLQAETALIKT